MVLKALDVSLSPLVKFIHGYLYGSKYSEYITSMFFILFVLLQVYIHFDTGRTTSNIHTLTIRQSTALHHIAPDSNWLISSKIITQLYATETMWILKTLT